MLLHSVAIAIYFITKQSYFAFVIGILRNHKKPQEDYKNKLPDHLN